MSEYENLNIPKIIMQTSVHKQPEYVIDIIKSKCPGWDYIHFTDDEIIKYDQMSVVNLIMKFAPDWRRILNELQRNSFVGNISGLSNDNNGSDNFSKLLNFIKDKDFKNMRQWVSNNIDTDSSYIFRGIYDNMTDHIAPQGIPQVILILADYQYKNAFVADHELNVVACLTEIMANVEFK